jgi:Zn-dependent peptidase ImmA (M78 family)
MELNYPCKANGMYIISKMDVEHIAYMILNEYMPNTLRKAAEIDIDALAENFLYLTVRDELLCKDDSILGVTAFYDIDGVPCLDNNGNHIAIDLQAGTVLLNSLLSATSPTRRRFTLAHECAHWILHRSYHSPTKKSSKFRKDISPYIACRSSGVEQLSHARRTDEEWEEWQADSLAAAMLMPYHPFNDYIGYIYSCRNRSYWTNPLHYKYVRIEIISALSDYFNVSKRAAEIRLTQVRPRKKKAEAPKPELKMPNSDLDLLDWNLYPPEDMF